MSRLLLHPRVLEFAEAVGAGEGRAVIPPQLEIYSFVKHRGEGRVTRGWPPVQVIGPVVQLDSFRVACFPSMPPAHRGEVRLRARGYTIGRSVSVVSPRMVDA